MTVEITLKFEDIHDADAFLAGIERGHIDGRRLYQLRGNNALSVVGKKVDSGDGKS